MGRFAFVLGLFTSITVTGLGHAQDMDALLSPADRMIERCVVQRCKVPVYALREVSEDPKKDDFWIKIAPDVRTMFVEDGRRRGMRVERYRGPVGTEYVMWNRKTFERYWVYDSPQHPGAVEIRNVEIDGVHFDRKRMIAYFADQGENDPD